MPAPSAPPPSATSFDASVAARDLRKQAAKRTGMNATILAAKSDKPATSVVPGRGNAAVLGGTSQ
jgi:hypothetical protein